MKKFFIVFVIFAQVLILSACSWQLRKDAGNFIDEFDSTSVTSEYVFEGITYGLYLSQTCETVYQFKIDGVHHYINVLSERSFAQYETGTEISEAERVKHIYYLNSDNNNLYVYNQELAAYQMVEELENNGIKYIIQYIHKHLEKVGEPISFSEFSPVIKHLLRMGQEHGRKNFKGEL